MFSNSSTQKEVKVTLSELDELPLEEIKGFVTSVHNSQWWVGCVLYADEDSREIKINFYALKDHHHRLNTQVNKMYWSFPKMLFSQKLIQELSQVVLLPLQNKRVKRPLINEKLGRNLML